MDYGQRYYNLILQTVLLTLYAIARQPQDSSNNCTLNHVVPLQCFHDESSSFWAINSVMTN